MNLRGFTLIEILIVVAILAIISIWVLPNFFHIADFKDLSAAGDRIVAVVRDAQARSLTAENSKVWGVKFDANNKKYIMSTYVLGAFETPVTFVSLKSNLEFIDPASGTTKQVIFDSLTGKPSPNVPVIIKIGLAGDSSNYKTIIVNANGTIEIQ